MLLIDGWWHARDRRQDLRAELPHRADRDQAARACPEPEWETLTSVDADNLAWLKRVVTEVGWPGRSAVGEDGAHAAWLLVQHADRDPAFQRKCLELVTQATACGEASPGTVPVFRMLGDDSDEGVADLVESAIGKLGFGIGLVFRPAPLTDQSHDRVLPPSPGPWDLVLYF